MFPPFTRVRIAQSQKREQHYNKSSTFALFHFIPPLHSRPKLFCRLWNAATSTLGALRPETFLFNGKHWEWHRNMTKESKPKQGETSGLQLKPHLPERPGVGESGNAVCWRSWQDVASTSGSKLCRPAELGVAVTTTISQFTPPVLEIYSCSCEQTKRILAPIKLRSHLDATA